MDEVLIQLRAMQLLFHQAHHLSKGDSFFGDHKAFEKFYLALEETYDTVAERVVSHYSPDHLNLGHIAMGVANILEQIPPMNDQDNNDFFMQALHMEKILCGYCATVIQQGVTEGTKNMLANICDESEKRQYLQHQRIR